MRIGQSNVAIELLNIFTVLIVSIAYVACSEEDNTDTDSDTSTDTEDIPFSVKEIAFAFQGSSAIVLKSHTRPDGDEPLPVPEYVAEVKSDPVAVAEGTILSGRVLFVGSTAIDTVEIGSSLFANQTVSFSKGKSEVTLFESTTSLPHGVGVHTLTIDWHMCNINDTDSPSCNDPPVFEQTEHPLYVTHATPVGTPPFFAELVEKSCVWTKHASNELEIVEACFDGTWSLGDEYYYYVFPFYERTGDKVDDILDFHRGSCSEWAIFLLRCIEAQGVDVYTTNLVPDEVDGLAYDQFRIHRDALGGTAGPWIFGNHVFVVFEGDFGNLDDPTLGTVYDPTYHLTGGGWGGYEDVVIDELGIKKGKWYENPGFGNGSDDDVLNTKLYLEYGTIDDWDYQDDGSKIDFINIWVG